MEFGRLYYRHGSRKKRHLAAPDGVTDEVVPFYLTELRLLKFQVSHQVVGESVAQCMAAFVISDDQIRVVLEVRPVYPKGC